MKTKLRKTDLKDDESIYVGEGWISNGHWLVPCHGDERFASVAAVNENFAPQYCRELTARMRKSVWSNAGTAVSYHRTSVIVDVTTEEKTPNYVRCFRSNCGARVWVAEKYSRILHYPDTLTAKDASGNFMLSCDAGVVMPFRCELPAWVYSDHAAEERKAS